MFDAKELTITPTDSAFVWKEFGSVSLQGTIKTHYVLMFAIQLAVGLIIRTAVLKFKKWGYFYEIISSGRDDKRVRDEYTHIV